MTVPVVRASYLIETRTGRPSQIGIMGPFNLLAAFARNPNRVLSREQLLDTAPGREMDPFDRSIDIRVTRIRKKVEANPGKPQVIKTVRNAGYIYVPPKAAA